MERGREEGRGKGGELARERERMDSREKGRDIIDEKYKWTLTLLRIPQILWEQK